MWNTKTKATAHDLKIDEYNQLPFNRYNNNVSSFEGCPIWKPKSEEKKTY